MADHSFNVIIKGSFEGESYHIKYEESYRSLISVNLIKYYCFLNEINDTIEIPFEIDKNRGNLESRVSDIHFSSLNGNFEDKLIIIEKVLFKRVCYI